MMKPETMSEISRSRTHVIELAFARHFAIGTQAGLIFGSSSFFAILLQF